MLRWQPLVAAINPRVLHSAEYPGLASALTEAFDARMDVDASLPGLLANGDCKRAVAELTKRTNKAWDQMDRAEAERRIAARLLAPQGHDIGLPTFDRGIARGL